MYPHLPEFHKFLVIKRRGKPAVLYEGSVDELFVDGNNLYYILITLINFKVNKEHAVCKFKKSYFSGYINAGNVFKF